MTTAAHDRLTVLPPQDLEAMLDLSAFLAQRDQPAALVGPDGQTVPLPPEAYRVLVDVAAAMRKGKAITVAPVDQLLTTRAAADFLGISRPTLVQEQYRLTVIVEPDVEVDDACGRSIEHRHEGWEPSRYYWVKACTRRASTDQG